MLISGQVSRFNLKRPPSLVVAVFVFLLPFFGFFFSIEMYQHLLFA